MALDPLVVEAVELLAADRVRSHEVIFQKRHPQATAPFQRTIVRAFHSAHPRVVVEAFRGAAKSTLLEETFILGAVLEEFKNGLIIGASYDRACERLETIKNEIEQNEDLANMFGDLKSNATWSTDKIVLSNGVAIQAKGAGQSLRGIKHHADRPDFVGIDDLEDEESTRTPGARQEMLRWVYKTLIAACTRDARIRFIGNRLDPEAVIVKVANDPEWQAYRFPIMFKNAKGDDEATWPKAFPLDWIYKKREELQRLGLFEDFNQEYMVEADTPQSKIFRPEHFVHAVKPRVRTWEATWAMVDPARSIGKRSATTAIPVWSWIGARLIVWDCFIGHWLPDEIIEKMLAVDSEFAPVVMGVEEDALNQFILQPLRQAMVRHGRPLPLRPMSAKRFTQGRGKEDFIKSLQPFFAAGEVEFAKPLSELQAQFLSFPKGVIDGPNALAYALKMRPGAPIYDEFSQLNIVESLAVSALLPLYLAVNATSSVTTAQLVQYDGRKLCVLADWVEEGDPGQAAGSIIRRAGLESQGKVLRVMAPRQHFDQWANVGLRAALSRVPVECTMGGDQVQGREEIRALLREGFKGFPAVQIAHAARWTLNGFSGGYCRTLRPGGTFSDQPEDNIYAVLMAALESFCGLLRLTAGADDPESASFRVTADGRRYRSAMVDRDR